MTRTPFAVVLIAALSLGGCTALGRQFGPGFSLTDKPLDGALFSTPPLVVQRGEEYLLTWTQGTYPYFFLPAYEAMAGRLVFALLATSSTGNLAGRHREMKIEGVENIQALKRGGAYWWQRDPEPNGTFVPLKVVASPSTLAP